MIRRQKYFFDRTLKKEYLKGRSLRYLSNTIGISYSYITSIIQGRNPIDSYTIGIISNAIGYSEKELDNVIKTYFVEQ